MAEPFPLVSTEWLSEHLNDEDVIVLDASIYLEPAMKDGARGEFRSGIDEFEARHIPGARFADLFTQFSDPLALFPFTRPTPSQFAAAASWLGIGRHSHVVIYDDVANQWAARLWWVFRSFGHPRVSVLDGGLKKYLKEGHRLETGLTPYVRSNYPIPMPVDIMATTRHVLALVEGQHSGQLICFLKKDEFAGRINVQSRPGHIPGSASLPFLELVSEKDNTLKSPEELRALFEKRTALNGELVVTYCGGGVASTLGALALAVIGYVNTLEYDGSLAEWANDKNRPLETGDV